VTGEVLAMFKYAQTAESWRDHLAERELEGATEIAYQPAGPDIPGELRRFMEMASG
jgi:5,10-methylenetetrahydromethanopterin reductase